MKLRIFPSLLIFVSAYSPLSVIFFIQDFDWNTKSLEHPFTIITLLIVSFISIIVLWLAISRTKSSSPPIKISSVSNRSGEFINYTIPYMISFFVMELSQTKMFVSFIFFMVVMYVLTTKTHNIFVNPVLVIFGYNLYDIRYEKDGHELQALFLVQGTQLKKDEYCRIVKLSEYLFLVTDRRTKI